mmetsp:Transcript_109109/g.305062  ORF Transcript_109109/g.305062 Transcript_109109/m.305062 type:complete len:305 (-) Transcript_109109:1503-2417(-)
MQLPGQHELLGRTGHRLDGHLVERLERLLVRVRPSREQQAQVAVGVRHGHVVVGGEALARFLNHAREALRVCDAGIGVESAEFFEYLADQPGQQRRETVEADRYPGPRHVDTAGDPSGLEVHQLRLHLLAQQAAVQLQAHRVHRGHLGLHRCLQRHEAQLHRHLGRGCHPPTAVPQVILKFLRLLAEQLFVKASIGAWEDCVHVVERDLRRHVLDLTRDPRELRRCKCDLRLLRVPQQSLPPAHAVTQHLGNGLDVVAHVVEWQLLESTLLEPPLDRAGICQLLLLQRRVHEGNIHVLWIHLLE